MKVDMLQADNDNRPRPAAFDARVLAYRPMLVASARHLCAPSEREELVQETICQALAKWSNFREDGGFARWLNFLIRSIAQNKKRRKKLEIVDDANGDLMSRVPTPPQQEHATDLRGITDRIALMKPKTREAITLFVAGYDQGEIAARQGVTNQAISMRIQRARLELRAP